MSAAARRAPWACLVALVLAGCRTASPPEADGLTQPPSAAAASESGPSPPLAGAPDPPPPAPAPGVFGVVGLAAYPLADKIAPNGVEFTPIFSLDLHTNLWLSPSAGVYLFADTVFWGQKAAPGITNRAQGPFDFSKREFDLAGGLAWNVAGRWEARAFAYSLNNLNRGTSPTAPAGYADGAGVEGRYYLSEAYDALGTPAYDVARAPFVSLGYYPTKDLVDNLGQPFKPGPFARAYLTLDLYGEQAYAYLDATLTGTRGGRPKLLQGDVGLAVRPFPAAPRWEFRLGGQGSYDLEGEDPEQAVYLAVRFVY